MVTSPHRPAHRRLRHKHKRREQGAVLLVIMLIIIVTTAAAAVSIQNTTAEVRASGRELMLLHARYSAEAALVTTLAWIDILGDNSDLLNLWQSWQALPPPNMAPNTGGHIINNDASRHMAARVFQTTQTMLPVTAQPVSTADTAAPIPDPTGSFGPGQVYVPQPYEVDITDCFIAPATLNPGNQVNANAGNSTPRRFYCVLTVRNRLSVANNAGRQITWQNVGGQTVSQDRTGAAHDARASILTPTMLIPNP